MLIECNHCGAPLDVKQGQKVTKCKYCETTSQVGSMRTMAFETPQNWRAPPEWRPPEQYAADSAKVLVYHAASAVKWVVGGVTSVILFSIAASVFAFCATPAASVGTALFRAASEEKVEDTVRHAMSQVGEALKHAEGQMGRGKAAPAGVEVQEQLLGGRGLGSVVAAYKANLGASSIAVLRLVVHESHSSATLQDPKNAAHINEYRYRSGNVSGPEPVRLMGHQKTNLPSLLFDPDKLPLARFDELAAMALTKLGFAQAKVSHVIIEKESGRPVIRIYASDARDSGYVQFDDKGKVVRVAK